METRLNIRTSTETDFGRLNTYLEGHCLQPDFGAGGSAPPSQNGGFGLRHAFGTVNGFLFGQTWSNYMSFVGAPRILKLGGPHGDPFRRHAQVRYTAGFGKSKLSTALENPETIVAAAAPTGDPETPLPDLTVRYEYARNFAVAGVVRQLETQESAPGAGDDGSTMGYGVQARLSLPLLSTTRFNLVGSYGEGVGYYMGPPVANPVNYPDVYVENGDLEAIPLQVVSTSLSQRWAPKWSSNFTYTLTEQDIPDSVGPPPVAFPEKVTFATANLIYDATSRLALGIEYQRSTREDNRATAGNSEPLDETANRVQASAIFQF